MDFDKLEVIIEYFDKISGKARVDYASSIAFCCFEVLSCCRCVAVLEYFDRNHRSVTMSVYVVCIYNYSLAAFYSIGTTQALRSGLARSRRNRVLSSCFLAASFF